MESGNIYYNDNNNNNNNRKRTRSPVPFPQAPPPPSDAAFATAAALVGLGLGGQTTTAESTPPSSFSFVGGQESTTSAVPPPPPPPPSTFQVPQPPQPEPKKQPPKTIAERLLIINERNEALNELLKLTSSHETNFSINDDEILQSLSEIFCNIIDWNDNNEDNANNNAKFISTKAWIGYTNLESQKFANHCKIKLSPSGIISLEQTRVLEAIITILRNLAYVSANLRHLAYSTCTLQLLVGCLYENSSDVMVGDDNFLSLSQQKSTLGSRPGYLSLPALYILVNLTPYLDVTGQKLLCDKLFLSTAGIDESQLQQQPLLVPHQHTFGQLSGNKWGFGGLWLSKRLDTKEDIVQDITKDLILDFTKHHLIKVWDIFPALLYSITNSTSPRLVTMVSVDLLIEFINHAKSMVTGINDHHNDIDNDHSSDGNNSGDDDNENNNGDGTDIPNIRSILKQIPDIVLERLMDLLYVPRLGPDALEYIDPVHNIVTRVTTLKLLMGYDATVDTDVRDRALDVLVALCELDSPNIAKRIGRVTTTTSDGNNKTTNTNTKQQQQQQQRRLLRPRNRLLDSILPILVTQVGRNEAQQLASQLLKELAKVKTKENRVAIKYIQPKLINLSCNDARIAHLTFNFLVPDNDEDDDESDDDDTSSNNEEER